MKKELVLAVGILALGVCCMAPFSASSAFALEKGIVEGDEMMPEKALSDIYPEILRKAIFREIGVAEDRAAAEAKPAFTKGPAEDAVKLQQTLQRKYVTEVLKKYNISPAQELELYKEALEKQWAAG